MIDPKLAALIHDGVGIHLGTRNARLEPNGARAAAVAVEDDGVHVVVYVSEVAVQRLLPDLEENGQAAVVVARPIDERSCQLKGHFVGVRPARADERPYVLAQWERFRDNLEHIGIPRSGSDSWVTWPAVAVRIRVTAVFEQTPGPGAGEPIR